ncbi:MAG: DNA primase [Candidatus Eiseniibacteriota bacterium]
MTDRTAQAAKEEVRNAIDIVAIVGERVPLRRMGRAWKGLCPFHAEKTPSFTVNPERQIWHCFGCNRGGDVFSFLMELDKVTFPEALASLAERAGVELPKGGSGAGDAARNRLYQANALANDFFKATLRSTDGAKARAYLAGRGFDEVQLDRFQVGFAPEGWESLLAALSKLLPASVLEEAGLVVRRGDGTHYDRFRDRITFPIEAAAGRVAGFGARALDPEQTPKYLNSPETAVYRKGGLLFGLPLARAGVRQAKQVIVAEGYMDVMRLHAAGFTNAVCTSGTALTPDQARLLARFEQEVLLVYDGDDAGIRAADRALDALLGAGIAVRVLVLPEGEDPDSFLAKRGASEFTALAERAGDAAAFLAAASLATGSANPTLEARVRRYVELLGRVEDPIRRRMMVRRGSVVFGLEEDVLVEALAKRKGGKVPTRRSAGPRSEAGGGALGRTPAGIAGQGPESKVNPVGLGASPEETVGSLDPIERELAARCLTEEGAVMEVAARGGATCFHSKALQGLLRSWLEMARAPLPEELRALTDLEPMARGLLAELAVEEERTDEMSRRGARELLARMEERRLKTSIQELDRAIRQAEGAQDSDSLGRLVAERRDLASKLHSRNHPAPH